MPFVSQAFAASTDGQGKDHRALHGGHNQRSAQRQGHNNCVELIPVMGANRPLRVGQFVKFYQHGWSCVTWTQYCATSVTFRNYGFAD